MTNIIQFPTGDLIPEPDQLITKQEEQEMYIEALEKNNANLWRDYNEILRRLGNHEAYLMYQFGYSMQEAKNIGNYWRD